MAAESRTSLVALCLAILLHVFVVIGFSWVPWPVVKTHSQAVSRTVVRFRRPGFAPARLPTLSTPSSELSSVPTVPRPMLQPQQAQPTPSVMPRPQPSPVIKAKPTAKRRVKTRPVAKRVRPVTKSKLPTSPPVTSVSEPLPEPPLTQPRQASVPPEPAAAAVNKEALLQAYLGAVATRIERHKRYPLSARRRGLSGKVVLQFTIHADGRVSDPQIIESSGHVVFRNSSLRTLKRVPSMPPFPAELKEKQIQVTVPLVYTLKPNR